MNKKLTAGLCAALLLFAAGCGTDSAADTPQEAAAQPQTAAAAPVMPAIPAADTAREEAAEPAYAGTLFDTSYVHTIDVRTDGEGVWTTFIQNAEDEEYIKVDIVIDGELYRDAAIRAKGNSSKMRSRSSGKYSFKVEFDHYTDGLFRGLDKLALNNLSGDASCMRDYIVYRMMAGFGVPAPLCSYVFITVDGEDWGFYMAVEGIEDAFLERNYGPAHGALYKPDNLTGGGGAMRGDSRRGDDVKLKYIDDDPASYPNLFGSAKTDVSRRDQYRVINALRLLSEGDVEASVDTEELLRYLVVHSFVSNGDSYTGSSVHNYYLYEDGGVLSMLPWDYNEAFGDFGSSGLASVVNDPIDTPVKSAQMSERPMVGWVFTTDEAYVLRYHTLYQAFLDAFCGSGWIRDAMLATRDLIGPYVERDPRSFTTYDAFLQSVDEHILFFELRAASVQGQLDGTIPSTSAGQSEEPDALVDTSALPSRRGMSGGGGGGRPGERQGSGEASGGPSREASGEN